MKRIRQLATHALIFLGGWAIFTVPVQAQLTSSQLATETSLRLAPIDAATYSGSFQLQRQWESFMDSEVVKAVLATPFAQTVKSDFLASWEDGQLQIVRQNSSTPLAKSILALLQDMFSNEAFFFADSDLSVAIVEANVISTQIGASATSSQFDIREILTKEQLDRIPFPNMVLGFKLSEPERGLIQIDQLEGITRILLSQFPFLQPLSDQFQRVEDERGTRLALTISNQAVPWDFLAEQLGPQQSDTLDYVREVFAGRSLTITIGLLDEFMVFALSDLPEEIASLGSGSTLADHEHLKPVMKDSEKDLATLSYVSDDYSAAIFEANLKNYFSKIYGQITEQLVPVLGPLPDFLDGLESDLAWLDAGMDEFVPEFRGATSYTFFNESGMAGYTYSRTEPVLLDDSKPLEILQHMGGDPLAMIAFREQYHPEYFQFSREVVRKIVGYLAAYHETLDPSSRDHAQLGFVLNDVVPMVTELADLIETKFLPALKDGQQGWVFSGGEMTSRQWLADMPVSDTPLPLPEFAVISGVSDRDLLISAYDEAFTLCDSVVAKVRQIDPKAIPAGYDVPRPNESTTAAGLKYFYPIPEDCPVPKAMAPQATFLTDYMISTYSDYQSEKLSSATPLESGSWAIDPSQNLMSAVYLDLGGAIEFFVPWVQYAVVNATGDLNEYLIPPASEFSGMTGKDLMQVVEALKACGEGVSYSHSADGGSVTYWESRD